MWCSFPDGLETTCAPYVEQGGVRVCRRSIAGSPNQQILAQLDMSVPIGRLRAVLSDVPSYPQIMPPTQAVQLLRRDESGRPTYHMVLQPGWVSRRDYCIRVDSRLLPDGRFVSGWDSSAVDCPSPASRVVRIRRAQGAWTLTPLASGATRVNYCGLTEFGGLVPAWMVDSGTVRGLPAVFSALARAAVQPQYGK